MPSPLFEAIERPQQLAAGAADRHYLRAGSRVICLAGAIEIIRPHVDRGEYGGGWSVPPERLAEGEHFLVEMSGPVTVIAQGPARFVYLHAQPVLLRFYGFCVHAIKKWVMIHLIRRGVEQSGSSSGS